MKIEIKSKGGDKRSEYEFPMETAKGVTAFLSNYHHIREMAYSNGDMDAVAMLVDFKEALDTVEMTDRQKEAIHLVCFVGMNQREAGDAMGVKKQAVQRLVYSVTSRVADYYVKRSRETIGGFNNEKNRRKEI